MCEGRTCLILDDIIDTAGTLVGTVEALLEQGAKKVYACASHPVLSGPAMERIANSRLEQLIVTNTIPLREEALQVAEDQGAFDCRAAGPRDREHSHGDQRQHAVQLAQLLVAVTVVSCQLRDESAVRFSGKAAKGARAGSRSGSWFQLRTDN